MMSTLRLARLGRGLAALSLLLSTTAVAFADRPDPFPPTADTECGDPHALTMIERLPPVRTVIFDPVSNSFAFLACKAEEKENRRTISAQDYLDSQRLALSTQKIRLLILPYNPHDGDLTLTISRGEGIEFQEISGFGSPPSKGSEKTAGQAGQGSEKPEMAKPTQPSPAPKLQSVSVLAQSNRELLARLEQKQVPEPAEDTEAEGHYLSSLEKRTPVFVEELSAYSLQDVPIEQFVPQEKKWASAEQKKKDQEAGAADKASKETAQILAALLQGLEEYKNRLSGIDQRGLRLRRSIDCVDQNVQEVPAALSTKLSRSGGRFTLARDVTWEEVQEELALRNGLFATTGYKPCPLPRSKDERENKEGKESRDAFLSNFENLGEQVGMLQDLLDLSGTVAAQLPVILQQLFGRASPDPKVLSTEEWSGKIAGFAKSVTEVGQVQAERMDALAEVQKELGALRTSFSSLEHALHVPAAAIQRFNFTPLENGKSITFLIQRGKAQDGDGTATTIPNRVNELTLNSAPVYTFRFGTGLVQTRLENATFKAVSRAKPGATMGETEQILQVDERGNGKVVPGLFAQHYWLRRSPLLRPTWFEMFVPTFSVGVPLSNNEGLLSEVLLGLNWELAPGIQLNVGRHFGRVQALAPGYELNNPLQDGVDVSQITEKRSDSAYYFGIVLQSSIFDLFSKK